MPSARNLRDTFVVMGRGLEATPVDVTPSVYEELDRRFDGFRGCALVARYDFTGDWPTWEMHPAGDEVVVLLSGAAEMVLDRGDGKETVSLRQPGSFVIVPKGTWHTARIAEPTSMLFVTPGEGTQNKAG
jgi:mannose-6-phosphate isomerase-like protein (cupin superfamily)